MAQSLPLNNPAQPPEPTVSAALDPAQAWALLQELDSQIDRVVLNRQHPITGLLPATSPSTPLKPSAISPPRHPAPAAARGP